VTTHVAESAEEYQMFIEAGGPMYQWLARNERDMADCGGVSPVQHLERHGLLGENLLAVHVNLLHPGDAERLAAHGVHVVHCPRSHGYFQHRPFARPGLERAGVNLCLGTDSLVTVHKHQDQVLDLFAEMRQMLTQAPGLDPMHLVRMATLNGARALGDGDWAGKLAAGGWADAIAVPFGGAAADVAEAVVHHAGDVTASLIAGAWAVAPPAGSVPNGA
jgi:cytosine/adenosine deaminase-related metal-dependent hydrolase